MFLKLLKFIIPFLILVSFSCKKEKVPFKVEATYEEPIDPLQSSINWEVGAEGLQASVVSTDIRFTRSILPEFDRKNSWVGTAWKGEQVSAQLLLWSSDSITNVRAEFAEFESENGQSLPASVAKTRFVKYVIVDEFAKGCGYRKPENFKSSLASDVLDNVSSYSIKKRELRPLWVSIKIPQNAAVGLYKSSLKIYVEGGETKEFEFSVNVINRTLPPSKDWKFHLDLWQNPFAVARYHNVEPWSNEHWSLLSPLMKKLAEAGQKVITVSLNKRPWGGQTYDSFDTMIDWVKNSNGTWSYNYTKFDDWVSFMMELGIKKQINCYSMVPWGNEFYYFDEATQKEIKIKAVPGTSDYEDLWVPFLKDFSNHLNEKGWNKITRLSMDERAPEEMKALFSLLKNNAPEFGTSLADNHKSYQLYPDQLMDLSVAFGSVIDKEDLAKRKEKGYVSTHYVCCSDVFPNVFTFSEPAEADFIGWYTSAANLDGFLRWAYNSWVVKPMQDSRFSAWPSGDTSIIYPDNRSSTRFERLLEGIQDAEKIRILREDFIRRNKKKDLEKLNETVAKFNITDRPENLNEMINNAKKILNDLSVIE